MNTVTISIINFRTADLTIKCMKSVINAVNGIDANICVIDNFSDDGSDLEIEKWIELNGHQVSLIRSEYNSGFSGGHNQIIQKFKSSYYILLNSDAEVRPDSIEVLLNSPILQSDVGILSPRLEYDSGEVQDSHFRFFSPLTEFVRGAASGPVTKVFSKHQISLGVDPKPNATDWVSFACVLLRREMIEDVGFLDDGYFLYFEDAEYCFRASKRGWRVQHEPRARVVHRRGGSAPVKKLAAAKRRLPAYYYASRTRFLYQSYGWTGLLFSNLLWHAGRLIAQSRWLLRKTVPKTNMCEARDIWINFLDPLSDRKTPK